MLSWTAWLLENISMDGTITTIVPRQEAIRIMCHTGLYPFIEKEGYKWRHSKEILTAKVLRLLYFSYSKKTVLIENYHSDWDPEHQSLYEHLFDTDRWSDFWEIWGKIEDFDDETGFAYRLRFRLPYHVWNWIDLETSSRTAEIENSLYETESGVYNRNVRELKEKEDPYLQDLLMGTTTYDKHHS
jgi:hypothetical protein